MAPDELSRSTLGLSAIAGGAVWGLYHLTTTLLAGQPVHRNDVVLASLNVAAAMVMGALVAYFLGPVIAPWVPVAGLREPHALGFGIGAISWEAAPFAYRWVRLAAAKRSK